MPERIQMSRQRPWRAEHPDAVIVARPTVWGNPFRAYQHCPGANGDWGVEDTGRFNAGIGHGYTREGAIHAAVSAYRRAIEERFPKGTMARASLVSILGGRDLACWCPLDQQCHADVLLELANPIPTEAGEGDR